MSKHLVSLYLIFLFFITSTVSAQLTSPTSDFKVATSYSSHDSIFIFNQFTDKKGSLKATVPEGVATFEWSAYDTINHNFSGPVKTETNVDFSIISGLNSGGYRVQVTKSGLDTTMTGWIFLNDFPMSVEKDNAGEVHFYRRTCEFTNLIANATPAIFKYQDPSTGGTLTLNNAITVTWTANPSTGNSLGEGSKIWIEDEDLPTDDTEYTARATDNFNLWREDKVKYISIIPKADFETDYKKKYSDSVASAPLKVIFTNKSENAVKYTWIFGDGDTTYLDEPDKNPEPHTYLLAKKDYKIKLIAESKEGCVREDTVTITINESELETADFFSPNGDGQNDVFLIRNVSLREFHFTVFSRSGRKVYEFRGPDINSWEGWDGNIGNTPASPGIYFYVLEAMSWEQPSVKYKPTKYSNFFYLFRD